MKNKPPRKTTLTYKACVSWQPKNFDAIIHQIERFVKTVRLR